MEKLDDTIEILKALADSTRFKILKIISSSGNNLCVSAISNKLELPQPVISQHLKILKNANLVSSVKIGNHIHYSVNHETVKSIFGQIQTLLEVSREKCSKKTCDPSN